MGLARETGSWTETTRDHSSARMCLCWWMGVGVGGWGCELALVSVVSHPLYQYSSPRNCCVSSQTTPRLNEKAGDRTLFDLAARSQYPVALCPCTGQRPDYHKCHNHHGSGSFPFRSLGCRMVWGIPERRPEQVLRSCPKGFFSLPAVALLNLCTPHTAVAAAVPKAPVNRNARTSIGKKRQTQHRPQVKDDERWAPLAAHIQIHAET